MVIKNKITVYVFFTVSALSALIIMLVTDPLPQDMAYHNFSDSRGFSGIPNILNVISNLPFLIVGIMGLIWLKTDAGLKIVSDNRYAYYGLFTGASLVALGSGYYHLWPDNETLVWDRLPMTIAFMALFSIVISEFISPKKGKIAFLPLLAFGLSSVLYWHITESRGAGDLRWYGAVQFFPMLAIPVILLCFRPGYTLVSGYWWLLFAYMMSKVLEFLDPQILTLTGFVSGHSLKHISAALGLYVLLRSFQARTVS